MRLNFSQKDLKQIIANRFENVKNIQFDSSLKKVDNDQKDFEPAGVFDGCAITFSNGGSTFLNDSDITSIMKDHLANEGFGVSSDSDITFRMNTRWDRRLFEMPQAVPVFRGIAVECQELDKEVPVYENGQQAASAPEAGSGKWGGETVTFVSGMRRDEHVKSLSEMENRDLCEMIRAHFESHPTLPGEKAAKDTANKLLKDNPEGKIELDAEQKDALVQAYADTRIRQAPVNMAGAHPDDLRLMKVDPAQHIGADYMQDIVADGRVEVSFGKVELQRSESGTVYVVAEQKDGGYQTISTLSEKFLKNNPMNVDSCEAEIQLVDYSNGKMKNVSARVVVDTDLMSGDVINLNNDMLVGLDQTSGLEQ